MAKVVLGITGGVSAYKSASLIRLFSEAGHAVKVVATTNALKFIGKATLEALSHNTVELIDPDLFTDVDTVKHVELGQQADLLVISPGTASFIAKVASGIADDLLTTTFLATTAPVLIAPAMHTEMWNNPATQENIRTLQTRGVHFIGPASGRLTGKDSGPGRLSEPNEIFEAALELLSPPLLKGVRVLVTAGGTREKIDDARFIGNYSSGKQGQAFALVAKRMGANVTLISSNFDARPDSAQIIIRADSALELQKELLTLLSDTDLLVMAAAVADFRPKEPIEGKLDRAKTENPTIELVSNPDILKSAINQAKNIKQNLVSVGFAAESSPDLQGVATKKWQAKGCDFLVANDISSGKVFGSENNSVLLLGQDVEIAISGTKNEIAAHVLTEVANRLGKL
ncbi:MAG: bifunctional phosphopantothenoylcysteine decarboxylase/phosphopantothenate--cysteine ligase CoaBC [Actinomycetota bacterium]